MTSYSSKSGKASGVTGYRIGRDFIVVQFHGSKNYKYSYQSAGKPVVEKMKRLALASEGLSTYITQNDPKFE
jgi:hypothetical protein